jgi:hypothetical protein
VWRATPKPEPRFECFCLAYPSGTVVMAEVYCEGRLFLNAWIGKDGAQRTGLAVTVWEVLPLARIGRKQPKKPRPEQTEAPPFDDDAF